MNYIELFKILKDEGFSEDLATVTTISHAIHLSLTPTDSEMVESGKYSTRVNNTINSVMWEHEDLLEEVHEIRNVLHDYDIQQSLGGIGGTEPKTIKELINEKENR